MALAYFGGCFKASHQTECLVLDEHDRRAVLHIYGDTVIASKVDEQLRLTGPIYCFLSYRKTKL
jgi:hypothetical protein